MEMNKKAVFFSMTAIIIVSVLFIMLTSPADKIASDTQEIQVYIFYSNPFSAGQCCVWSCQECMSAMPRKIFVTEKDYS